LEIIGITLFLLYVGWNTRRNWRKVQQNETAQGIVAWAVKKYLK
jgi:hypothetical protein